MKLKRTNKKKAIVAFILILALSAVFCIPATAEEIKAPAGSGAYTFSYVLNIENNAPYAGIQFRLRMSDENAVTFNSFTPGIDVSGASAYPFGNYDGVYSFGFWTGENKFSGNLAVGTLNFTYTGTAPVTITITEVMIARIVDGNPEGTKYNPGTVINVSRIAETTGNNPGNNTVNKSLLAAAIANAETLNGANYTQTSWTALGTALNAARTVYGNASATQQQTDDALSNLTNAVNALQAASPIVTAPDKSALKAAIANAETLNGTNYTQASWTALGTALNAARTVYGNASATQQQTDDALSNLTNAVNALQAASPIVTAPDKSALKAAIANAETLNEAYYTQASWSSMRNALAAAKQADAKTDATQEQIDAVAAVLRAAISALTPAQTGSGNTGNNGGNDNNGGNGGNGSYNNGGNEVGNITIVIGENETPPADIKKASKYFDDVPEALWFWAINEIDYLFEREVIKGTADRLYSPKADIKRGDFILMLVRAYGLQGDFEGNFSDVPKGSYYYDAIGIARKLGIAQGVGENRFASDTPITRQDMMVLVARTLQLIGKPLSPAPQSVLEAFADYEMIADYARESGAALVQTGLIKGDGTGINPLGKTTRAEMAVVVYRLLTMEW